MDLYGHEFDTVLIFLLLQLLHNLKVHLGALVHDAGHRLGVDDVAQSSLHELEDDTLRVVDGQGEALGIGDAVGELEGDVHGDIVGGHGGDALDVTQALDDLDDDDGVDQGDLDMPAGILNAKEASAAQVEAAFELMDFVDGGAADVECDQENCQRREEYDGEFVEAFQVRSDGVPGFGHGSHYCFFAHVFFSLGGIDSCLLRMKRACFVAGPHCCSGFGEQNATELLQ